MGMWLRGEGGDGRGDKEPKPTGQALVSHQAPRQHGRHGGWGRGGGAFFHLHPL